MASDGLYEVWREDGNGAVRVSSFLQRDDAVRFVRAEQGAGHALRIRSPRGHWLDIGPDRAMPAAHNRRRSPRVPHSSYCELEINPGRYAPQHRGRVLVPIHDVSREGLGLVTPSIERSLLVNDRVFVVLEAGREIYRLPARIAWCGERIVGVEIGGTSWVLDEFAQWLNRSVNV